MNIIGFGHYSRTGKDSTANALLTSLKERGIKAKKIPFAWKLKDIAHQLYGWAGMREAAWYDTPEGEKDRDIVLPEIGKSPVQIWIDLGTPAIREQVYIDTWIDYVLKTNHDADVLLIPDVRFPNEAHAIKEMGGSLVKVIRPGYGPRPSIADRSLLCYQHWDFVIGSTGQMSELKQWADGCAHCLKWDGGPAHSCRFQPPNLEAARLIEEITPWERDHEWLAPGWEIKNNRLVAA